MVKEVSPISPLKPDNNVKRFRMDSTKSTNAFAQFQEKIMFF